MILNKTCNASEITRDATSQRSQGFLGFTLLAGRQLIISPFCIWNKLPLITWVRGSFQLTLFLCAVMCSRMLGHACRLRNEPACYPARSQPGQRSPATFVPVNSASSLPRRSPAHTAFSPGSLTPAMSSGRDYLEIKARMPF